MIKENNQPKQIEIMRHSTAHVLAAAAAKLYPKTKFGIGPVIENGFYYDFEFPQALSDKDLPKIEKEAAKIKKAGLPFERQAVPIAEAQKIFKDQPYKLELIADLAAEGEAQVSVYQTGDFVDLCRGPHLADTSQTGACKLQKIAGAYWKGSEQNAMLTRIYGLAFATESELADHLALLAAAEERDHRKIGKELDLFSFHPEAPGDVFWHPKGLTIVKELMSYWREVHEREGYVEVRTPEILTHKVWEQSGHTKNFLDKMYRVTTPDAKEWNMAVKPMNCDGGILIYKSQQHSYKEFPIRMGELGVVHRYESSGELHGVIRPREFTQDDAHIYCTPGQVKEELQRVMELCFGVYETFGLKLDHLELSTRPENSIGSDEIWERAESIMRKVLAENKAPHLINEGDGAFYGPKFDFHLKDSIGRTWQCSTIQLDFAQPENFDLEYVTEDGQKERPVMIHRVLYGSIERFLGILIENCAGEFPVWLAPVQAIVIPISEKQNAYAEKVAAQLRSEIRNAIGTFRIEVDESSETMDKKIRSAQLQKIPYMLIVGGREETAGDTVSLRLRSGEDLGSTKIEEFSARAQDKIVTRSLEI